MALAVLVAALASWVGACAPLSAERLQVQDSRRNLTIAYGASVRAPGTHLTLTFESLLEDSRCPTGVACVWEGDAAVRIAVTQDGKDPVFYTLHTGAGFDREVVHESTHIGVVALDPYPQAEQTVKREDRRLTLSIGSK